MKRLVALGFALVALTANAAVYEVSRGSQGLVLFNDSPTRVAFCRAFYYNSTTTWDFTIGPGRNYTLLKDTINGRLNRWRCRY